MSAETVGAVGGLIAGAMALLGGLAAYHKWFSRRAIQADDVARVVRWFTEPEPDEDRETLPTMLRGLAHRLDTIEKKQDGFASRLDQHLVDEEAKIVELTEMIKGDR